MYGDSRVALINGKVYRPGDRLDDGGGGSGDGEALRVADVRHDRVLLERGGATRPSSPIPTNRRRAPLPSVAGPAAKSALAGANKLPSQASRQRAR